jgi:hypothetical protein
LAYQRQTVEFESASMADRERAKFFPKSIRSMPIMQTCLKFAVLQFGRPQTNCSNTHFGSIGIISEAEIRPLMGRAAGQLIQAVVRALMQVIDGVSDAAADADR